MTDKPDGRLAQWAAMFLRSQKLDATNISPAISIVDETGLTVSANALLQSVDDGGVPLFVTGHLKQIAQDNGIEVAAHWTPNEIIAALRGKRVRD
jgi:hypothetical protein